MFDEKFIGKSKTIISLVLATLVMWSDQFGLNFTQEDSNFIMDNLNELIATGLAGFAAWGRVVARTTLKLKP
ncbi:MAG: hypothetical protein LC687_01275 [Actinobacteria bacterium]|nr:hypothetical protein [Actinomycetota bacterium]MCA1806487.1 hypothetical protein [Actinomycetota bacterium]